MRVAYKFKGMAERKSVIMEGPVDKLKRHPLDSKNGGAWYGINGHSWTTKDTLRVVDPETEKNLNAVDAEIQDLQEQINALQLAKRKMLEKRFPKFKPLKGELRD